VALDDTRSDIHATPAVFNPLAEWRRQGDAMAIRTCVITPHNGLDSTVNYVWHLLEGMAPNACPFNIPSLASVVAVQTASPKLPIFGVFGVSPFAAQHRSSGKGRS
jgi:hypothetical protein